MTDGVWPAILGNIIVINTIITLINIHTAMLRAEVFIPRHTHTVIGANSVHTDSVCPTVSKGCLCISSV